MKCEDFIGKVVESIEYSDSIRVLIISFTDGTQLQADDGMRHGVVVTTPDMDLEPNSP